MISLKYATLMAVAAFAAGSFFAPPVQQAIAAVIATDVQCAGCVGTSDLAGNAVTAAKIKDNEVKAAEIATDAVGAAELQGVTKLLFAKCIPSDTAKNFVIPAGSGLGIECMISGVTGEDQSVASFERGNACLVASGAIASAGKVSVVLINACNGSV